MANPNLKSLKKENDELKSKLEEVSEEMNKIKRHLENSEEMARRSNGVEAELSKSMEVFNGEYEDIKHFRDSAKDKLTRLENSIGCLRRDIKVVSDALDETQLYSNSHNIKLLIVELKSRETASETSNLCVRIFNVLGADVKLSDIDIAYRVTPKISTSGRPKPIVCKFVRRLAREKVMAVKKRIREIQPDSIDLRHTDTMKNVGLNEHLTPTLQLLLIECRSFKESYGYKFCWAKSSSI